MDVYELTLTKGNDITDAASDYVSAPGCFFVNKGRQWRRPLFIFIRDVHSGNKL
jgi:hypothetical protein